MKHFSVEWMMHLIIIIRFCKSYHTSNYKDPELDIFRCTSGNLDSETDRIRLYFQADYLYVNCKMYFMEKHNKEFLENPVPLYASVGMVPDLEIYNRSFKFFAQFTLAHDMSAWQLRISRKTIAQETDIFPVDEWYVRVKFYYGVFMTQLNGSLLDVMREPILQWKLGREVPSSEIIPILKFAHSLKVVKRLCASDVAILTPLFVRQKVPNAGIYLLVTKSAFTSLHDKWFDVKPVICSLIKGDCNIWLLDIALTNGHLVLLTNRGLFISHSMLFQPGEDAQKPNYKVFLWYTEQCYMRKTDLTDYLSITVVLPGSSNIESCRYNLSPFKKWKFCFPPNKPIPGIISTVWDNQRNTIIVLSVQTAVTITVWKLDNDLNIIVKKPFQEFHFPDTSFSPIGLFLYANLYYLYAYGSQVWYSKDGGNSFDVLIKLKNDSVIKAVACSYSYAVIFITSTNNIYYTKPGLSKYALFNYWDRRPMAFSCDHCGNILRIFLNESTSTGLSVEFIDHKSLIAIDNAGFSRPLALQYVTRLKALFFEHISWIEYDVDSEPMFSSAHVGKLLKLSSVGSAEITEVHKYRGSQHFLAVAIARIVVPYHAEPFYRRILMNKLLIVKKGDIYHLELLDAEYGFIADDFEKTVVIPGYSSFLIVRVISTNLVIAHGTMPEQTPDYFIVEERQWFMFDFGSKSGTWSIVENECVTSIEDQNNLTPNPIVFLDINDSVKLTFELSSIGFAGSKKFEVVIGNRVLLDIDSESYYDKTGRSVIIHYITNNFNVRGYSTMSIFNPDASLLCPVTSFSFIICCACPVGKYIFYEEPISISTSEWLYGNSEGTITNLKTLPVNYRPPSMLGINIPTTDNIYNADPSKPKFRDFYKISKETGRYKQCAGKRSVEECGCTEDMKLSSLVEYSDCRERQYNSIYDDREKQLRITVYRVLYPAYDLNIPLWLRNKNKQNQSLYSPFFVTITELNNRTNWKATSTKKIPSFSKLRNFYKNNLTIYNPDGLVISLFGSELYHFRVTVIPGVSLCDLFTEFQIYVDDPPMAYPLHYLISMVTAIVLGAIAMVYFFFQYHYYAFNITPCWKFIKVT